MADSKDSTLIIEVDLACETCCTKIQNVLCKIKEKENIKSISYDTKKNEVTIIGSFNPDKLYCKLRCKAGCCIKGRKEPPKKEEKKEDKKEEKKEKPAVTAEANTTVNMQFTQVCVICYPWPCKDPISHCQTRRCEGPTDVHPPTCGGGGSCSCGGGGCRGGGPCSCGGGGCRGGGSCRGGGCGWRPPTPNPPIFCPGPSCRGCMGCRLVHEQKYEYHEYPPNACIVM